MDTTQVTEVRRDIQRRGAIWAHQQFQLVHPEFASILYGSGLAYFIHVSGAVVDWPELVQEFRDKIRPVTVNVSLVSEPPEGADVVQSTSSASDDAWMVNEPMPGPWINDLLALASPDLPAGYLTFDFDPEGYVFVHHGLSEDEARRVDAAFKMLKLPGDLRFVERPAVPSAEQPPSVPMKDGEFLDLPVLRRLPKGSPILTTLVEEDEDGWRQFASSGRDRRLLAPAASTGGDFSALFGADDDSDVRLSELLCLYDVVNIVPSYDLAWLPRHGLDLKGLEELVSLGRLKLVLPAPVIRYPAPLVEAAASVDTSSVLLSRRLGALTVINGQRKDPLLYGPFSNQERIELLRAMHSAGQSTPLSVVVATYAKLIELQNRSLFRRGASTALGSGFGPLVGELVLALRGIDVRLELATVGAMVEWAAALGSTYVPRSFGGYEESRNAAIVANFFNRTHHTYVGDVANRMHTVVDGLLTTSSLSPIEIARGTTAKSFRQFRRLAQGMVNSDASVHELQVLATKMNEDVLSFERRRARLGKYKILSTIGALAAYPLNDKIDKSFPGASVFAAWMVQMVLKTMRERGLLNPLDAPLNDLADMVNGLATMTSMDAVVVSRTRADLRG
jgi:hypothetical protein